MVEHDDKELRDIMQKMADVPFRSELKSRVLQELHKDNAQMSLPVRKHRRNLGRFLSVASGLVAACAVVGIVLQHEAAPKHSTTFAAHNVVPFREDAQSFDFASAPLKVSDVHIGTVKGDPKNTDVVASITNTSDKPVHKADVFGVLSFSPKGKAGTDENWIDFVNGSDQVIQPGQTILWWFRPSGGVLHAKSSYALIETPHLVFYDSHLVKPDDASAQWTRAKMEVENVYVEPREDGADTQSVQVDVQLKNTSNHEIDLSQKRAVIWFSEDKSQSFLSSRSIRFLYHMLPTASDQSWPQTVAPGHTVEVNFRVLSDGKADFFSRTPHVIIIDTPDVSGGK